MGEYSRWESEMQMQDGTMGEDVVGNTSWVIPGMGEDAVKHTTVYVDALSGQAQVWPPCRRQIEKNF
jgi:hypothetical protein